MRYTSPRRRAANRIRRERRMLLAELRYAKVRTYIAHRKVVALARILAEAHDYLARRTFQ